MEVISDSGPLLSFARAGRLDVFRNVLRKEGRKGDTVYVLQLRLWNAQ